jgi:hypothetical protein
MRYLALILLLCFPAFAAQNPSEPDKSRDMDVPIAVPGDAKPPADNPPPKAVAAPAMPASGLVITAEQWARPRSGESIVQLPGLGTLVEAAERDTASRLVIRFAGGDEGSLWAEELRSWLVALGLPSARIALEPGPSLSDRLLLELRTHR